MENLMDGRVVTPPCTCSSSLCPSDTCRADRSCVCAVLLADENRDNQERFQELACREFGSGDQFMHLLTLKLLERFIPGPHVMLDKENHVVSPPVLNYFLKALAIGVDIVGQYGITWTTHHEFLCTCGILQKDADATCAFDCLTNLLEIWFRKNKWNWYLHVGQKRHGKNWPTKEDVENAKNLLRANPVG